MRQRSRVPIAMRWRSPPENWPGERSSKCSMPSSSATLGKAKWRSLLAESHVAAHREVGEDARLLKDHPQCAPVRRHEKAFCLVLPDLVAHRNVTVGSPLESLHEAQAGALSRAGMTEEAGDAATRQRQLDLERELATIDAEASVDLRAHGIRRKFAVRPELTIDSNVVRAPMSAWRLQASTSTFGQLLPVRPAAQFA